ncbi:MAG TPA: inverse autotransporter beta domain-containing protein [Planctomycetaceae bacterium]|nr:inverse autotransporter beta domain-containing protein [Planctomycetaceae bacterium]
MRATGIQPDRRSQSNLSGATGLVRSLRPASFALGAACLRFLSYSEASDAWGYNVGLGVRTTAGPAQRIWGGNLYFDYRDLGSPDFQQIGVGVESLGPWDFRANGYLPVGDDTLGAGCSNPRFFERNILLDVAATDALPVAVDSRSPAGVEWRTGRCGTPPLTRPRGAS